MRLVAINQVDIGLVGAFLAGNDEGFITLADCSITALSTDASYLASVHKGRLLLISLAVDYAPQLPLPPAQSGDAVTCVCWLCDKASSALASRQHLLSVGYESGCLAIFSTNGERLWSAQLQSSPVVQIIGGDKELALLCLFEGGVIACAPSIDELLLHGVGAWVTSARAPLLIYELPSRASSPRVHAITCCGALPPLPLDLVLESSEAQAPTLRNLVLVAAQASELQLHLLQPPPASPAPERLTDLMAARDGRRLIARGLSAFTSALLTPEPRGEPTSSSCGCGSESADQQGLVGHKSSVHKSSHVAMRQGESSFVRALSDSPRGFVSLALEPHRRRWLAATDTFGRVLLLEPRSLVCMRLFKGYRDAQCGWTAATAVATSNAHWSGGDEGGTGGDGGGIGGGGTGGSGGDGGGDCGGDGGRDGGRDGALLVIYAPRRGLLEVWQAPYGGRVFACNVGGHCLLLAPHAVVRSAGDGRDRDGAGHRDGRGGRRPDGHGPSHEPGLGCFLVQQRTGVILSVVGEGM